MRRIVWTREARANLEAIRGYIGEFNPLAAQRMAIRLVIAAESLAGMPERGRKRGGLRELVAVKPYIIRYRVEDDVIEILRIRHGAMQPD